MASLGNNYRNEDAPTDELVPARTTALMQVIGSDVVDNNNRNGKILKLQIEIITGPYERRQIFENLNIVNPSEKAQAIAQRNLAQLCDAIGLPGCSDSDELHHKPFMGTVGVQEGTGQYGPQNRITKYAAANASAPTGRGASAPAAQEATGRQPSAPPASGGGRPWGGGRAGA
jgi:hypothetical protein